MNRIPTGQVARKQMHLLILVLLMGLSPISAHADMSRGLVVVSVTKYSEAQTAAIEPGDVLLSWSRGGGEHPIESPFDLMRIEVEQSPLGVITIKGSRNSQSRSWELGQEDWGLKTRPNFSPAIRTRYLRARQLVANGKEKEAQAIWTSIALHDPRQSGWYSWCAGDAAEHLTEDKRWRESDLLYRDALTKAITDPIARTFLLRAWAITFEERREWITAATLLHKAAGEGESVDAESLLTSSAVEDYAILADWRRDVKTAKQFALRASVIDKRLAPQSLVTAHALIMLAMVSIHGGDPEAAGQSLAEAKPLLDKISPLGPDSAWLERQLASLLLKRGDLNQAKERLIEARDILQPRWPDSPSFAGTLSSLAFISAQQGDSSAAELQLQQALAIYRQHPIDPSLGLNLIENLATVAYQRRQFAQAEKYGLESERIAASLMPQSIDHAACLMNLGMYAFFKGDLKASKTYLIRASEILQKVAPSSYDNAKLLNALSRVSRELGDLKSSETYALKTKAIFDQIEPEGIDMADLFEDLADIARRRGNLQAAEEFFRRALGIRGKLTPSSPAYADCLAELAEILQANGKGELSRKAYEQFADAVESDTARLGGNEDTRMGFRSSENAFYKEYIDLLVQQGRVDESFEVVERSRARTLLELLAQSSIDIRQHLDPQLRAQEESLRSDFAAESDRRLRLLTEPHSAEQVQSSDARMASLMRNFRDLESHIRDTSPAYAEVVQPKIATVQDVQAQLVDPDTLLLEYSLGEKCSYLWLISPESASVHALPKRAEIEREVRLAYRATTDLTSTNRNATPHAIASSSEEHLTNLSRMILGPVESALGHKRLLIVPDGAISFISFAALPLTNKAGAGASLLAQHEIVYLPSTSILMALRQERATRRSPSRTLAVLADPVFDPNDPRIKHPDPSQLGSNISRAKENERSFAALRSIELTRTRWANALGLDTKRTLYFVRLPYSRREAEAIIAATPKGQNLEALDFKASRSLAISRDLAQYRILHFATHGLVDTTHPEFSGLLFSLFDERGTPQIGLLSLEDIYSLNLPVDMVVLSACETALGKEVKGEGVMGLTRGFMYAGASRVVASLWKVNDVATTQLMAGFYRSMEQDHLPVAAALRKAQLEMANDKRWASPYYWAGFELQGDWK